MATRTDPALDVALDHYNDRQRLVVATAEVAAQMWSAVDPARIAETWTVQLPELTAVVSGAQLGAARQADPYVSAALEADDVADEAVSAIDPGGFAGTASDGRGLMSLLTNPVVVALMSIQDGMDIARALGMGRANLDMLTRTQVADAGRAADQVSLTARPRAAGYVRLAVGNSCARCLILAGQSYAWNAGFKRHPMCDCIHVPKGSAKAKAMRDPRAVYDSMSRAERMRAGFRLSDQRALAEGADFNQIVNARHRPSALYTAGGRRFTREGTTRRGVAGRRLGAEGRRSAARITPDQIFREAGDDRDEALRLLYRHGYLLDPPPLAVRASAPGPATSGPLPPPFPVDVRPALARARNIDKVEKAFAAEARRITGRDIPASFKNHDVDIAREHAEGILRALEEFPDVDINVITAVPLGHERAYAITQVPVGRVILNPRYASDPAMYRESLARAGGARFHLRGETTPVGTGAHEVAHAVHHQFNPVALRRSVSRLIDDLAGEAGLDVVSYVRRELGEYSLKHIDEMIASAVADALTSGPAASRLSQGVLDLMRRQHRAGRSLGTEVVARATEPLDLNRLTVRQLREMAAARGLTVPTRALKNDLVRLLDEPPPASVAVDIDARIAAAAADRSALSAAPVKVNAADFDRRRVTGLPARVTADEQAAILRAFGIYQNGGDRAVNSFLRGADLGELRTRLGRAAVEDIQPTIAGLDAAMAHSRLRSDVVVWRSPGSGIDLLGPRRSWGDDLTGRTWRDPGYSSTSSRESIANGFAVNNGVRMRIVAPKGQPAVRLRAGDEDELELLLGRDVEYRVVRDRGWTEVFNPRTGKTVKVRDLDVEIVPAGRSPAVDLEDTARARQVVVDHQRAVADTLSEVAGLLGDAATPRLLAARAEAIAARTTGDTKQALASLVRAMKTGDAAKIDRALEAAARKLGLRRVGTATEIVDFDRTAHAAIAGDRIAQGAKVRIVRPGYDTTINGEDLRLSKAVVEALSPAEVRDLERRAIRAAARERNRLIEQVSGTERLLAELDYLISQGASKQVMKDRLALALMEPGQPYAGVTRSVRDDLMAAVINMSSVDRAGSIRSLRAAMTRATRNPTSQRAAAGRPKITPGVEAGKVVAFDPDTMDVVGGTTVKPGARVTVMTRGSTMTLPDGSTLVLTKPQVIPPTPRGGLTGPTFDQIPDSQLSDTDIYAMSIPDRQLIKDRQKRVIAPIIDGEYGTKGLRAEVVEANLLAGRGRVAGKIYDAAGKEVGTFTRYIERQGDGTYRISHAYLQLKRSAQGSGFAEEFNQNLFDWYRRSGATHVDVHANIDVGGYTWATKGFDFTNDKFAERFVIAATSKVEKALRAKALPAGLTREQLVELRQYLDDIQSGKIPAHAFDISQFGRQPGQGGKTSVWPGKWLMLKSDWFGTLTL